MRTNKKLEAAIKALGDGASTSKKVGWLTLDNGATPYRICVEGEHDGTFVCQQLQHQSRKRVAKQCQN